MSGWWLVLQPPTTNPQPVPRRALTPPPHSEGYLQHPHGGGTPPATSAAPAAEARRTAAVTGLTGGPRSRNPGWREPRRVNSRHVAKPQDDDGFPITDVRDEIRELVRRAEQKRAMDPEDR